MNAKQTVPVYHCIVLIDSPGCSTITYIVLSTSCNIFPGQQKREKTDRGISFYITYIQAGAATFMIIYK